MDEALLCLEAEIPERAALFGKGFVVRDDHSPFAGGDVLVGVEAEGADLAEAAAGAPLVSLAVHLRSVFDDLESMLVRNFKDRVHIHRQTIDVNNHDCPGL